MQINRIMNATRTLGKSQGYLGLPLRDESMNLRKLGNDVPFMCTSWSPFPDEILALCAGAPVHLRIIGVDTAFFTVLNVEGHSAHANIEYTVETVNCDINGPDTPSTVAVWTLTKDEISAVVDGAAIYLRIQGVQHPPVMLSINKVPDPVELTEKVADNV